MAEKPKSRGTDTRAQKPTLTTKAPPRAAKRTGPAASSGEAPLNVNTAEAPEKPEAAKHVTAEERWNMIADAAYYRAEKRNFIGGDPHEDWLQAEAEIDAALARRHA